MKFLLTSIIALCAFVSMAQQSIINNLTTTTVVGATTNTGIGAGFIGWNIDQVAVIQQTIVSTNNGLGLTNNVTKTLDTSDNGTDWVADQYTIATALNKTTNATSITRITNSVGAKYIRFGQDRNPNSNAVQTVRLTLSIKER
jgi:hypothetical protein